MNRILGYILLVFTFSCNNIIEKPELHENVADYSFIEYKYAQYKDSILGVQSNEKFYHLEIKNELDNWIAYWTEIYPTAATDTTSNEIEDLFIGEELTDGFTAQFSLNPKGDIDSLKNWKTLKSYTDSLTNLYYQNISIEHEKFDKIKTYINAYQTKDRLLNTLYKGIFAYHNFYNIDASFEDTLITSYFSFELNGSANLSETTIRISRPTEDLVDYVLSTGYEGFNDTTILAELEKLTGKPNDYLNSLKHISLKDTLYYRFNREEQIVENVFLKRLILADTIQFYHEISLAKE